MTNNTINEPFINNLHTPLFPIRLKVCSFHVPFDCWFSFTFCMLMLLAGPWFCRCHWLLLLLLLPINDSVKANRRHCSSPISMWRALPQKIELQMLGQADKSANQPFRGSSHAQHIQWKPRWALKVNPMNLKQLHFFGSAVIDIGFPVWRLPLKKYKHSALLLHTE